MNKTYRFYHKRTGQLHDRRISIPEFDDPSINAPADHAAIEGDHDHLSKRVDLSGSEPKLVDWMPSRPTQTHEWNTTTRRWVIKANVQAAEMEIARLEASQATPLREAALGDATALQRLREIDAAIKQQRKIISTL